MGVLTEKNANIAFDIPVDKAGVATDACKSPRIQKRLESWEKKPKSSPEQLEAKVLAANRRRREQIDSHTTKIGRHNDRVQKACREKKAERSTRQSTLDEKITKKLAGASEKKSGMTARIVKRLTKIHREKHDRGEKALTKEADRKRELEERVEIKHASATERKEKLVNENVERIAQRVQSEREKGSIALQKAEAHARQLDATIDAKLAAALDRKETMAAEKVESLAHIASNKMERGRMAIKSQQASARELDDNIENRMKAAASRRMKSIVRSTGETEQEKLDRALDARRRSEDARAMLDEAIQDKLMSASVRKNNMIAKTVEQVSTRNKAKQKKAALKTMKDQEDARFLRDKIDSKIAEATERKELLSSAVKPAKPSNPTGCLSPRSPSKEEIDAKLNDAAARREKFLRTRSAKKTGRARHSPTSPSDSDRGSFVQSPRDAIESRMSEAAARRQALLLQKSEQAGYYANRGQPREHHSSDGRTDTTYATPLKRNIDSALIKADDREVAANSNPNPVVLFFINLFQQGGDLFLKLGQGFLHKCFKGE